MPTYGVVSGDSARALRDEQLFSNDLTPRPDAERVPLADARLVAPVSPTKIVCVGRNYREHAAELGNPMPSEPLLFLKAPSSLVGDGDSIELPAASQRVEHEGELAVCIIRFCRSVSDA